MKRVNEGFKSHMDWFRIHHGQKIKWDEKGEVLVPEKTVNFNDMKAIWLSTDISRAAELPDNAMMLDGTVPIKQKVAFQSFMRCVAHLCPESTWNRYSESALACLILA